MLFDIAYLPKAAVPTVSESVGAFLVISFWLAGLSIAVFETRGGLMAGLPHRLTDC